MEEWHDHDEEPEREQILRELEEALEDARERQNPDDEAKVLIDLGFFYEDQASYETAAEHLETGLKHLRKTGQYFQALPALFQLAKICRIFKNHERAFSLYTEAVDYAEKISDARALGVALAAKGQILIEQKSERNGLEMIFRAYQFLLEVKTSDRTDVLELVRHLKRKIPRERFELALSQSSVTPKVKDFLKSV